MTSENIRREIRISEASFYIDATGIRRDIYTARGHAATLKDLYDSGEYRNPTLIEALSTSALINYARAFSGGIRDKKIRKMLLRDIKGKDRTAHDRFMAWRDKHIAHSVNSYETNYLFAEFSEIALDTKNIVDVDVSETRIVGLASAEIEDLIALADKLIFFLDDVCAGEKSRILNIARNADIENIIESSDFSKIFPDKSKITVRRK